MKGTVTINLDKKLASIWVEGMDQDDYVPLDNPSNSWLFCNWLENAVIKKVRILNNEVILSVEFDDSLFDP